MPISTKIYRQKQGRLVVFARMEDLRLACYYCAAKGQTQDCAVSTFYVKHKDCNSEWCQANLMNIKKRKRKGAADSRESWLVGGTEEVDTDEDVGDESSDNKRIAEVRGSRQLPFSKGRER